MRPRRPLSVQDVGTLLARSSHSRKAILVGGQALNIWAVHFHLTAAAAAVSNDIDFFGSRADAVAAGLEWSAEVRTPSLDDHTPNSAVVLVDIDREQHGIDFLNSVLGVDTNELRRWAGAVNGPGYTFRVMHPLHVLQSQLENVYGALKRRDAEGGYYHVGRIALAIQVAGCTLKELLTANRVRDALNAAERIGETALSRSALEAYKRDELDLLTAIPKHRAWPQEFKERRLPQLQAAVSKKRKSYGARSG